MSRGTICVPFVKCASQPCWHAPFINELDDDLQVIFKLRRPAYLITSTMYIQDAEGNEIGEIRHKWCAFFAICGRWLTCVRLCR